MVKNLLKIAFIILLILGCEQPKKKKDTFIKIEEVVPLPIQKKITYTILSDTHLDEIDYPKGNQNQSAKDINIDQHIIRFCADLLYTLDPKLVKNSYETNISSVLIELPSKEKVEFFVYDFLAPNQNDTLNKYFDSKKYLIKSISLSKAPITGWFFKKNNNLCIVISDGIPSEFKTKINNDLLIQLIKDHRLKQ